MKKPNFYNQLDEKGKKHYEERDSKNAHSEKYIKLMEQEEPSKNAINGLLYSEEELEYLAKEDLVTLKNIHPTEAEWYMMND